VAAFLSAVVFKIWLLCEKSLTRNKNPRGSGVKWGRI